MVTKRLSAANRNQKESAPVADHSAQLHRLNRIKGQLCGVEKMILEKRYCPDIIQQIKATRSALKSLEIIIFEIHMRHCVSDAIQSKNNAVIKEKLDEIVVMMKGHT